MAAAAKGQGDPAQIQLRISPEAHLILRRIPCLIKEDGALHSGHRPEKIHDTVGGLHRTAVFLKLLLGHHRVDAAAVLKKDAVQHGLAVDPGLTVALLVKASVNDLREIDPLVHQISGDLHGPPGGVGIFEHARIMDDAGVQALCHGLPDLILVQEAVKDLAGGAGASGDHIDPGQALVGDVMVDAQAVRRRFQIGSKFSQALFVAGIQGNAEIEGPFRLKSVFHLAVAL